MTQNEKDLLIKDLCARLPYGVKVEYENEIFDVEYVCPMYEEVKLDIPETWTIDVSDVKPYLFPLSSMTNEHKRELSNICKCLIQFTDWEISFPNYEDNNMSNWQKVVHWCYKNHYDLNGLIPMGLAIDATDKNIY